MEPPVLKFMLEFAAVQLNAIANGFEACKVKVSRQTIVPFSGKSLAAWWNASSVLDICWVYEAVALSSAVVAWFGSWLALTLPLMLIEGEFSEGRPFGNTKRSRMLPGGIG